MTQHRGIVSRRFLFMIDHAGEEDIHLATRCAGKCIGAIVDVALALISSPLSLSLSRGERGVLEFRKAELNVRTYARARGHSLTRARVCTCAQVDSPDLEHPPVGGRLTESRIHLSSKQRGGGRDA